MQNVTDVDDPLLERAARDGEDWRELADREIDRYRGDMAALRVLPPDHLVGAVEALPRHRAVRGPARRRGALYDLDGDQYFSRAADGRFGAGVRAGPGARWLALFAERGGDPGRPGKKDPLDPLVWLAARPGEPSWESRFGPGRPGWHVECAAIATEYLGAAFDVQAGGGDLIFPHHEMSASHARVALVPGRVRPPVRARRDGPAGRQKMSKSLGNLVFVSELLAGGRGPDGGTAGHPRAPLPRRLGLDRSGPGRGQRAAGPLAGRGTGGRGRCGPPGGRWTRGRRRARGEVVLAAVRDRLADDLDAPGALAAVDRWAGAVLEGAVVEGAAGNGRAGLGTHAWSATR